KKTAIAGRLIPVAVVLIDQPVTMVLEQPIPDFLQGPLGVQVRIDQTTVFSFQACNASRHALEWDRLDHALFPGSISRRNRGSLKPRRATPPVPVNSTGPGILRAVAL